jgi:predicted lipid-binding transport protein (Tim44 family)
MFTLSVCASLFGVLFALSAAAAAFVINPGNVYCVPVDAARPFEECTLTGPFYLVAAGGLGAGALFGLIIGGLLLGLVALLKMLFKPQSKAA